MKEMISDEISVATHIGVDKGAQALNSLGFILRGSPLSVKRVFLPERCPDIVQNKSLSLEMEFSNSTLTAVPRKSSISALKMFVSFSNSSFFTFIFQIFYQFTYLLFLAFDNKTLRLEHIDIFHQISI